MHMRTFIAIELPESVQQAIEARRSRLAATLREAGVTQGLRWVAPEKIHLTLRFLGDTTPAQRHTLHEQLSALAAHHAPFALTVAQLGCFPNLRRPSVIWLGVDGDGAALHALQSETERAAQTAGFHAESRAFSPHLTLARVDRTLPADSVRALSTALAQLDPGADATAVASFAVTSFVHMQSVLKPTGAEYTVLARYALTG